MNHDHAGVAMLSSLKSDEEKNKWQADPVAYMEAWGAKVPKLDENSRGVLRNYLTTLDVQNSPQLLGAFSIRCTGCKVLIAGTVAGMSAAIGALIGLAIAGTGGADAVAAPEEAVAGAGVEMAVLATETALPETVVVATTTRVLSTWVTWAIANPVKAAAMAASGAALAELVADIIEALCERAGACAS